ncbi:MAG TPA: hypothetical protein VNA67_05685 [Pseudonocardiaceae bacterium]|nr:hypothetical protein [Pseudonocardiaceae bacterium]
MRTLTTMQGVVADSTPAKHSVQVDWFRRDPGGTTIFVLPGDNDVASQLVAARDGDVTAQS